MAHLKSKTRNLPRRESIRLPHYDYTEVGAYFVTVCADKRRALFAKIIDDTIIEKEFGSVIRACWMAIPEHFPYVSLDAFVIMPNHIHGILVIYEQPSVGAQHAAPANQSVAPGSLGAIIRSFKSASTKHINELRKSPSNPIWQRNYYEHVIRNDDELDRIRQYIIYNPVLWAVDRENPATEAKPSTEKSEIDTILKTDWMEKITGAACCAPTKNVPSKSDADSVRDPKCLYLSDKDT